MNSGTTLAIVLTTLSLSYFLYIGVRSAPQARSLVGFFLANRTLTDRALGHTVAAAGLSNAAVGLAYLLIFPSFGFWTLIALAANALGQILFIRLVATVMERHSYDLADFTTVGNLLLKATSSRRLSWLADAVTITAFTAALLAEFVIGAQLFSAAMPGVPFSEYIGFAIVAAIVISYIVTGGFVATVESDSWQLRLIVAACLSLVLLGIAFLAFPQSPPTEAPSFVPGGAAPNLTIALWAVNTVFLSLLFPIGQLTSWQRVAATKPGARIKGLWRGFWLLLFFYSAFSFTGYVFARQGRPVSSWADVFQVMLDYGGIFHQFLYPVLFVGLVAAMISTADSNAVAVIYSRFSTAVGDHKEVTWSFVQRKIYIACVVLFAFLLAFFVIYKEFGNPQWFLQIIFALFGFYLLLVPLVASVVLGRSRVRSERALFYGLLTGALILLAIGLPGFFSNSLSFILAGNLAGMSITGISVAYGLGRRGVT